MTRLGRGTVARVVARVGSLYQNAEVLKQWLICVAVWIHPRWLEAGEVPFRPSGTLGADDGHPDAELHGNAPVPPDRDETEAHPQHGGRTGQESGHASLACCPRHESIAQDSGQCSKNIQMLHGY